MSKILTVIIICLSISIISFILAFSSSAKGYKSLFYPIFNKGSDGQILEDAKYRKLQNLAGYPIVGNFYVENFIEQTLKRNEWEKVIEESSIALMSIMNSRSYKIWYYKAVAECASFQIQSCQRSLYEAEILAPRSFSDKISNMKEIFNYRHKTDLKARRKQVCEM